MSITHYWYGNAGKAFGGLRRFIATSAVTPSAKMPPCGFKPQPYTVSYT